MMRVLVTREAEIPGVDLRDFPQTRLHLKIPGILHATVLDEQGEVPFSVGSLGPAIAVAIVLEGHRLAVLQFITQALLNFPAEPVQPAVLNGVLQARMCAVGAVAVSPAGP
jgi:hypothetical protein